MELENLALRAWRIYPISAKRYFAMGKSVRWIGMKMNAISADFQPSEPEGVSMVLLAAVLRLTHYDQAIRSLTLLRLSFLPII